jgi:organic radical activating enzyme
MNAHTTKPARRSSRLPGVATSSMCHVCFAEIPATVERWDDGAIYLTKTCPAHGTSDVMVERDAEFCLAATRLRGAVWTNSASTILEVTHRCNNRCPNCYHEEDRGQAEPGIDEVLGRVASIATPYICLVGGEPTVRRDLPALVAAIHARGRHVSMYSNGIRLADKGYASELVAAGLQDVAFSMHHPEYSHPSIYKKKLAALDELAAAGLCITHLSFSLQHAGQIPDILDFMERNRHRTHHFRIRSAYRPEHVDWFVSDLYALVKAEADRRGKDFRFFAGCQNTRYQVGFLYDDVRLWLMSWPSNLAIDLGHARGYPKALLLDGVETHFCRAICIQDGLRRGWFAGRRIEPQVRPAVMAGPAVSSERPVEGAAAIHGG